MLSLFSYPYKRYEGMTQFLTITIRDLRRVKKPKEFKSFLKMIYDLNTNNHTALSAKYLFFKRSSLITRSIENSQIQNQYDMGKNVNIFNNPKFKILINQKENTYCVCYGTPDATKLNFISKALNSIKTKVLPYLNIYPETPCVYLMFKFDANREKINQEEYQKDSTLF